MMQVKAREAEEKENGDKEKKKETDDVGKVKEVEKEGR